MLLLCRVSRRCAEKRSLRISSPHLDRRRNYAFHSFSGDAPTPVTMRGWAACQGKVRVPILYPDLSARLLRVFHLYVSAQRICAATAEFREACSSTIVDIWLGIDYLAFKTFPIKQQLINLSCLWTGCSENVLVKTPIVSKAKMYLHHLFDCIRHTHKSKCSAFNLCNHIEYNTL